MKKSSPQVVYKKLLENETVALVMEHELRGVTPDMLDWCWSGKSRQRRSGMPELSIWPVKR